MFSPSIKNIRQQISKFCINRYVNKICDKYYNVSPIKKSEWSELLKKKNKSQIQQMFEKLYPWVDKGCSSSGIREQAPLLSPLTNV